MRKISEGPKRGSEVQCLGSGGSADRREFPQGKDFFLKPKTYGMWIISGLIEWMGFYKPTYGIWILDRRYLEYGVSLWTIMDRKEIRSLKMGWAWGYDGDVCEQKWMVVPQLYATHVVCAYNVYIFWFFEWCSMRLSFFKRSFLDDCSASSAMFRMIQ